MSFLIIICSGFTFSKKGIFYVLTVFFYSVKSILINFEESNFKSLKETRNSSKIWPLDFEQIWQLGSEICFVKYQWTYLRLSPLCYFANLFTLKRCLILRGDVIRKWFLAWISFTAHNKGIVTKLAEKIGRENTAGQLFCNTHTALVLLCLTILLFYLV